MGTKAVEWSEVVTPSDSGEDITPIRSRRTEARRAAARWRFRWMVGTGVTALVVVGVVVVSYGLRRSPVGQGESVRVAVFGPSEDKEGCEWNQKELAAYLASQGVTSDDHSIQDDVTVVQAQTKQEARDIAGHYRYSIYWGRFAFGWENEKRNPFMRKIAAALGVRATF